MTGKSSRILSATWSGGTWERLKLLWSSRITVSTVTTLSFT